MKSLSIDVIQLKQLGFGDLAQSLPNGTAIPGKPKSKSFQLFDGNAQRSFKVVLELDNVGEFESRIDDIDKSER